MKLMYFIISLALTFECCSPGISPEIYFDYDHPDEVINLPKRLHEISGISFYKKKELACVQDEKGIVFFYDIKKDKLRNSVTFSGKGDYEGITNVNDTLYVLNSNGEISEIDDSEDSVYANTYHTFLSKENNTEGLCYDAKSRRLLVACKGKVKKGTAAKGMKAVYSFDLETKKLSDVPAFVIDPDSIKAHLSEPVGIFQDLFKKHEDKDFFFEPSEIAIDPVTGNIFVLSSVGKTILCMNPNGTIQYARHLDPKIFKQPEGMSFSYDGSMFISDEGRAGKPNLVKLSRLK